MELNIQSAAWLLLIAAVVAILARRLHLPYAVGLVAAGIVLAMSSLAPHVSLTRELIFTALLPPLLFDAAFHIQWSALRRNLLVVTVLATIGVLISAAVTATGMHWLAGWNWQAALVFGFLIAATDPVSVIATFKEARAHGRLLVLIESESLFNDGTAAVAFSVVLATGMGHQLSPAAVAGLLCRMVGGGILCGALVALGALLLARHTDDHLVEITCTTLAAYGSFLMAEHFGLSGILAVITAGLVTGNARSLETISARGSVAVHAFWEYAAFVANSVIFLLIGTHEAHQHFLSLWLPAATAIALVTLGRALAVYPCCLLFAPTRSRVSWQHQHVLFWGGLRGALSLALAVGLPAATPHREEIITICYAVVAFSLFVQGMTIAPLLRRTGEIPS